MALRPWLRPSSIASRNGSHKLMDETGWGDSCSESLNSTPNPVVTAFSLAGFAGSDPVVTPFSLAGFEVTFIGRFWVTLEDLGTESGNRNLRQLLWHRHRLVQMRTRVSPSEPFTFTSQA